MHYCSVKAEVTFAESLSMDYDPDAVDALVGTNAPQTADVSPVVFCYAAGRMMENRRRALAAAKELHRSLQVVAVVV
jgi:hypothetical protein